MKKMESKQKIFIAIGVLIMMLISLGIYINYRYDHLVARLGSPGILFRDHEADKTDGDDGSSSSTDPESSAANPSAKGRSSQGDMLEGLNQRVGRSVERADMVKVGKILLKRLSWDEIDYLYAVGSKDKPSAAELKKARKILRSKLTTEELATVKAMGAKYGQNLDFLN